VFSRLIFAAFLFACGPAVADDLWVESRDQLVATTIEIPEVQEATGAPLVVLAHGHGGSKEENGGFVDLASMLAGSGIASVRMDFPGCGDSMEEFDQNNITTMLHDIDSVLRFALSQPGIDRNRIGILGYSMGGRLAMLAADPQYLAMVLWAPAAQNGPDPVFHFLGGRDAYYELRARAVAEGSAVFTTPWGVQQRLGKQWFYDLERTEPLTTISTFEGPILILHGSDDQFILPKNSEAARDAAAASNDVRLDIIDGADHSFGIYAEDPESRAYLLEQTVAFFREQLLKAD
jgi:dienelactone hydrolase